MDKVKKTRMLMESYGDHFKNMSPSLDNQLSKQYNKYGYESTQQILKDLRVFQREVSLTPNLSDKHAIVKSIDELIQTIQYLPNKIENWTSPGESHKLDGNTLKRALTILSKLDELLFSSWDDELQYDTPEVEINGKWHTRENCVITKIANVFKQFDDSPIQPNEDDDTGLPY